MTMRGLVLLLLFPLTAAAQDCASAALQSREAFLYGRFEVRMQSAEGSGLVSSFFLYNRDVNCNWPAVNNEIDIEMTGNLNGSVQFTTHYPFLQSYTYIHPLDFNPHAGLHDYAIEWEPEAVRWFVDGELAYVQDAAYVGGLQHPMRLMMNLWAADSPAWVGPWTFMEAQSVYDEISVYAYTPGEGTAGTADNFSLVWTDACDVLDPERWETNELETFSGNFCTFTSTNLAQVEGQIHFNLTPPLPTTTTPVTFQLDASTTPAGPGDVVYLNGTFNNWCGTCAPMVLVDGTYTRTETLPSGEHEYLFTVNGWSTIGGAPLGSSCDFLPCDEYGNYGVAVLSGQPSTTLPAHCWASCFDCTTCPADGNGDGFVTVTDLMFVLSNFGCLGNCPGDLTADLVVSVSDLLLLLNGFGEPCE